MYVNPKNIISYLVLVTQVIKAILRRERNLKIIKKKNVLKAFLIKRGDPFKDLFGQIM